MIKTVLYAAGIIVILALVIDYFNRQKINTLRHRGIYPLEGEETDSDVERLIQMNRRIEAIKVYRKLHQVDLKTAKDAVDKLSEQTGRRWSQK